MLASVQVYIIVNGRLRNKITIFDAYKTAYICLYVCEQKKT